MTELKLNKLTSNIVKRAWSSLITGYRKDSLSGEWHWTDNESDTGFLKDVDALNTLIEPFLLSPESFIESQLKYEDIISHLETILSWRENQAERAPRRGFLREAKLYRGFCADPYPYIRVEVDFVDSASAVLRLIINATNLFVILAKPISPNLEQLMRDAACSAVDFLLEARIEDDRGVRWPGVIKQFDSSKRLANLFFTNNATLALHRAINSSLINTWIGKERHEQIDLIIPKAVLWTANQYDPTTNHFWLDEAKTQIHIVGVAYALELLYSVPNSLQEEMLENCSKALSSVVGKMIDLPRAASLQRDFFHAVALSKEPGITEAF